MEMVINSLEPGASKPLLETLLGSDVEAQRAALHRIRELAAYLPTYLFSYLEQVATDTKADSENRFLAAEFLLHSVGSSSKYTFFDKQALWPTGVAYQIQNPVEVCRAILQRSGQDDDGRDVARTTALSVLNSVVPEGLNELVVVASSEFLPLKIRKLALGFLAEHGQAARENARALKLSNIVTGPRMPSESLAISVYQTLSKIGDTEGLMACYTHEVRPVTSLAQRALIRSLNEHGVGRLSRLRHTLQSVLSVPWRRDRPCINFL